MNPPRLDRLSDHSLALRAASEEQKAGGGCANDPVEEQKIASSYWQAFAESGPPVQNLVPSAPTALTADSLRLSIAALRQPLADALQKPGLRKEEIAHNYLKEIGKPGRFVDSTVTRYAGAVLGVTVRIWTEQKVISKWLRREKTLLLSQDFDGHYFSFSEHAPIANLLHLVDAKHFQPMGRTERMQEKIEAGMTTWSMPKNADIEVEEDGNCFFHALAYEANFQDYRDLAKSLQAEVIRAWMPAQLNKLKTIASELRARTNAAITARLDDPKVVDELYQSGWGEAYTLMREGDEFAEEFEAFALQQPDDGPRLAMRSQAVCRRYERAAAIICGSDG